MHGPQGAELEAQTKRLQERMSHITYKILVMSGKGGVGKTTISVNLALALAEKGYSVGILDTDLHGPNVAKMLGAQGEKMYSQDEHTIEPFEINKNLKAVSLAFAGNDDDTPIVWRGPLKISVIKQFLADVNWGKLDYLIIDTPPGTGDEPLTVCQMIPELTGSVIVTTPQEVAILDSRKSVNFARNVKIAILGIVENMSGFVCPHCGEESAIFSMGGGERTCKEMGVPFLGRIPLEIQLMQSEDSGVPFLQAYPESKSAEALRGIVDTIESALASSK